MAKIQKIALPNVIGFLIPAPENIFRQKPCKIAVEKIDVAIFDPGNVNAFRGI
jgi:hypothetical protein